MTGRYRLVESIGQGGMGRVWRAADEMLDRQVAVKEMRIDGLDAEDTRTRRERTLREARATARIDHPNVVRVYDVVDEGERLWIVMELVGGRSLEQIMVEDGPLGPEETARIGLGLVEALRQVHARGVLHRDIKPGNVLVESGERGGRRVVLTDFGIAAMQDAKALTMVGMLVGSPDYMAPERISGRPQGPPSDIWSLGATLCAALGGRSPFSRDTTLATLHAVLYEEPQLPASAGPLSDILAALLEKEPTVRPALEDIHSALRPIAFPASTPTLPVGGGGAEDVDGTDSGAEAEPAVPESAVAGASLGSPAVSADPRGAAEAAAEGRITQDPQDQQDPQHLSTGPPAGSEATPPLTWAPRERPTPAYLETGVVREVRDPRVPDAGSAPEPVSEAGHSAVEGEDEPVASEGQPGAGAPEGEPEDAVPADAVPGGSAEPDALDASAHTPPEGSRQIAGTPPEGFGPVVGTPSGGFGQVAGPLPGGFRPVADTPSEGFRQVAGSPPEGFGQVADPLPGGFRPVADTPSEGFRQGAGSPPEGFGPVVGTPPEGFGQVTGPPPEGFRPVADTPPEGFRQVAGTPPEGLRPVTGPPPEGFRHLAEVPGAGVQPGAPAEPFVPPASQAASASTEAASAERSEVRSETPSGNSAAAALRAAVPTASHPVASAPTQDSLTAGAPTEHFPGPEAPTRDSLASAPTRATPRRSRPGVSLARAKSVPEQRPATDPDSGTAGPTTDPAPGTDPDAGPPQALAPGTGPDVGAAQLPGSGPALDVGTHLAPTTGPTPDALANLATSTSPPTQTDPAPGTTGPANTPDSPFPLGPHPLRTPPDTPTPTPTPHPHHRRRTTILVAVAAAVTAGAVVAAVLLMNGSPDGNRANPSTSTSTSPSASASTPGPSPTVEGTSRPPLPPGTRNESGLFTWIPPDGWKRTVFSGSYVRYTSPDGTQEIWGRASMATKDTTLLENWEKEEATHTSKGQGYRRIRLEETTFQDRPAVAWEYTVTTQGEPWHARLLGFRKGGMSYEISTWYQADTESTAVPTYEKVRDSFTAL